MRQGIVMSARVHLRRRPRRRLHGHPALRAPRDRRARARPRRPAGATRRTIGAPPTWRPPRLRGAEQQPGLRHGERMQRGVDVHAGQPLEPHSGRQHELRHFAGACDPAVARTAIRDRRRPSPSRSRTRFPTAMRSWGTHTLGGATQGIDTTIDGTACQRIGVTIRAVRSSVFAQIFGTKSSTTTTSSVAPRPQRPKKGAAPGLLILEPDACNALTASGQGHIEVQSERRRARLHRGRFERHRRQRQRSCDDRQPLRARRLGHRELEHHRGRHRRRRPRRHQPLRARARSGQHPRLRPGRPARTRVSPHTDSRVRPATRSPVDSKYNCKAAGYDGVIGTSDDCTAATATSDSIDQLHRLYDTSAPYNAPACLRVHDLPTRRRCSRRQLQPERGRDHRSPRETGHQLPGRDSRSRTTSSSAAGTSCSRVGQRAGQQPHHQPDQRATTIVYVRSGDLSEGRAGRPLPRQHDRAAPVGRHQLRRRERDAHWSVAHRRAQPLRRSRVVVGVGEPAIDGWPDQPDSRRRVLHAELDFTFAGQGAQYQTTAQFVSRTLLASGQGTLNINPDPNHGFTIPRVGDPPHPLGEPLRQGQEVIEDRPRRGRRPMRPTTPCRP